MSFILDNLGNLQYEIKETNKVLHNIIETMTILEKRISNLEQNSETYNPAFHSEKSVKDKPIKEEKF